MKAMKIIATSMQTGLVMIGLLAATGSSFAETLNPLVDDFNSTEMNSLGNPRMFLNDSTSGGGTSTEQNISDGVLSVSGEIVPPRGQPGWASSVLLLDPRGQARDASAYEGIRLLIKIDKGMLSVSANSTEITNYDYHAAPVLVTADGGFHEVKIPFSSMKRAWSEQVPLNTKTIASLSIVAFGMQQGAVDFAVDEVAFY